MDCYEYFFRDKPRDEIQLGTKLEMKSIGKYKRYFIGFKMGQSVF